VIAESRKDCASKDILDSNIKGRVKGKREVSEILHGEVE
jgi:hypothetical protein